MHLSALEGGERYLADALGGGATEPLPRSCSSTARPSFGPLTVNALAAADRVIVPVQAEYYALEGLSQLLGLDRPRQAQAQPAARRRRDPADDGRRTDAARRRRWSASSARHFGDLVFTTTVPRSVRLAEAPSHGLPAIAYDRRSAGAEAYWKVAMELVERT